tara:strand:- start:74963 stop:75742 length:780 start_codon:yes stop_codon:yes gene_type:complete
MTFKFSIIILTLIFCSLAKAGNDKLYETGLARFHGARLLGEYLKNKKCDGRILRLKKEYQKIQKNYGTPYQSEVRAKCQGSTIPYCKSFDGYAKNMKQSRELWAKEGPRSGSDQYDYDDFFQVLLLGSFLSNPKYFSYDGYKKIFLVAGDPEFPKSFPIFKRDEKLAKKFLKNNCHIAIELAQMGRYYKVLLMQLDGPSGLLKKEVVSTVDECTSRLSRIRNTMSKYYRASSNSDICKVVGNQKETYCKGETPVGCLVY